MQREFFDDSCREILEFSNVNSSAITCKSLHLEAKQFSL